MNFRATSMHTPAQAAATEKTDGRPETEAGQVRAWFITRSPLLSSINES